MKTIIKLFLLFTLWNATQAFADFNYPMQATKVANNVFAIITPTRDFPNPENGGWNSNSAFIVTDDGVLLFDSGSSTAIGAALRDTIATVTDKPVRWIVNSHEHGDHWLGNAAFSDTVTEIYASDTVTSLIKNSGARWITMFNEMTGGITGQSELVVPTTRISKPQTITFGGVEIQLMLSGGSHSPGDLMLWLPRQKVLIPGDVVYSDRMPSTNAGSLKQWIKTLETLQGLQPEVVIPGHGVITDQSGLKRLHELLMALWDAVAEGIDDGKSDFEMYDDVVEKLADFKQDFPGLEDKVKRDLSPVFLQVEAALFE